MNELKELDEKKERDRLLRELAIQKAKEEEERKLKEEQERKQKEEKEH